MTRLRPDNNDDWQVNDLALCIKCGPWRRMLSGRASFGPPAGAILTVRRAEIDHRVGCLVLWFEGWPGDGFRHSFTSRRFRKITPPEADEFDRETIALLTGKPIKERA